MVTGKIKANMPVTRNPKDTNYVKYYVYPNYTFPDHVMGKNTILSITFRKCISPIWSKNRAHSFNNP